MKFFFLINGDYIIKSIKKNKSKEFFYRLIISIIGIPIIVFITIIGRFPFFVFINLIMIFSIYELFHFVSNNEIIPNLIFGVFSILILNLDIYFYNGKHLGAVIILVIISLLISELFSAKKNSLINVSLTLFGIFYVSLCSSYILIREYPLQVESNYSYGGFLILFIFSIIWTFDISAYLLGSLYGKTPLFSRISPKKSWEGSISGALCAILISLILNRYLLKINLNILNCIIFSLIICISCQLGDLVESMFKRDSMRKDSSKILPGHGGILDRFDGFIFAGPIAYFLIILF